MIGILCTANVNRQITDKLRYLSVISKQTHQFSSIYECYNNHRQMSVKMNTKNNTQQKNWEIFVIMKKVWEENKNLFVDLIKFAKLLVDLAFGAM